MPLSREQSLEPKSPLLCLTVRGFVWAVLSLDFPREADASPCVGIQRLQAVNAWNSPSGGHGKSGAFGEELAEVQGREKKAGVGGSASEP